MMATDRATIGIVIIIIISTRSSKALGTRPSEVAGIVCTFYFCRPLSFSSVRTRVFAHHTRPYGALPDRLNRLRRRAVFDRFGDSAFSWFQKRLTVRTAIKRS